MKRMKSILLALLCALTMTALVSCSNDTPETPSGREWKLPYGITEEMYGDYDVYEAIEDEESGEFVKDESTGTPQALATLTITEDNIKMVGTNGTPMLDARELWGLGTDGCDSTSRRA